MIKSVKIELTNYLGSKKEVKLEPDQIDQLNKQFIVKENLKRLVAACKSYSNDYWVTGYINNHKVCWYQWNQV